MDHLGSCFDLRVLLYHNAHCLFVAGSLPYKLGVSDRYTILIQYQRILSVVPNKMVQCVPIF